MLPTHHLISIVVPVFNEEESIQETIKRLLALRGSFDNEANIELIFIDDGSNDSSLRLLRDAATREQCIKIISFSRNFGHQIAITAGIDAAQGDYVAVIDADLQDPPELIRDMYSLALAGYDVVYGKRRTRAGETMFKKLTATAFYRILSYMCEIPIPTDTGDFRLMSRRAVNALSELRERHRFVRGMVPWVGFPTAPLEYDREERFAGTSKYPLRKMLAFATNGILSFSRKPLAVASRLGFLVLFSGLLLGLYMLGLKLFTDIPVAGLTVILLTIIMFSGMQIILIGVVGEYIARIFEEVKGRPLYVVAEKVNF
ncbi:glycosyltransferase family 2 protein [Pseudodesulfovibrio tunisiensis]|uniref:glycosyltransferase family 2 protein n=1 Tax=Pseudodesulfovibrio tunisiensis TaxID=463192 RepID=UPI001FB38A93|nr:glycosyltransferase family 2 protein [Pseudodesulfovibrio tunisiensis]